MKIIYKFDDGSTSEVEVDEELGLFISAEEKHEQNEQRDLRRKVCSLDSFIYEGLYFIDDSTPDYILNEKQKEEWIESFLSTLTFTQRKRLEMKMDNPNLSYREIAKLESVNKDSIIECFDAIRKKYEKFLKNTPPKWH